MSNELDLDDVAEVSDRAKKELSELREKLKWSINHIAEWTAAISINGGGWDYWDDFYKTARYADCPIRKELDEIISSIEHDERLT